MRTSDVRRKPRGAAAAPSSTWRYRFGTDVGTIARERPVKGPPVVTVSTAPPPPPAPVVAAPPPVAPHPMPRPTSPAACAPCRPATVPRVPTGAAGAWSSVTGWYGGLSKLGRYGVIAAAFAGGSLAIGLLLVWLVPTPKKSKKKKRKS